MGPTLWLWKVDVSLCLPWYGINPLQSYKEWSMKSIDRARAIGCRFVQFGLILRAPCDIRWTTFTSSTVSSGGWEGHFDHYMQNHTQWHVVEWWKVRMLAAPATCARGSMYFLRSDGTGMFGCGTFACALYPPVLAFCFLMSFLDLNERLIFEWRQCLSE